MTNAPDAINQKREKSSNTMPGSRNKRAMGNLAPKLDDWMQTEQTEPGI